MKSRRQKTTQPLTADVSRCLRGGNAFPETIVALHRAMLSKPTERIEKINSFLLQDTFRIPETKFGTALRFDNRHIDQLATLVGSGSIQLSLNYLYLATEYILHNIQRIQPWIEFDIKASELLIRSRPEDIRDLLLSMPLVDQQALTSLRLYAALHAYSDSAIKDFLEKNMTSVWTKSRLLYPTIYYATNLPTAHAFDQMLSHLVPQGERGSVERRLIKLLLEPHKSTSEEFAFRGYVALMSHPFDALEYLVSDLELRLARRDELEDEYVNNFRRLAVLFPTHRVTRLLKLADGDRLPLVQRPVEIKSLGCGPGTDEGSILLAVLDIQREQAPRVASPSPLMAALINLRWNRYPSRADYDILNVYRQRFSMLTAGAFIDFVSRSQFLFEREEATSEILALIRGVLICEVVTPFILTSPGGYQAIMAGAIKADIAPTRVVTEVTSALGRSGDSRKDRVWIKAANWALMPLQQSGRVEEWAKQARKKFPLWIEPRYLSGLDWYWLNSVMEKIGILPLRDSCDGVYILFMRQVEEGLRESVALRVAIEPIVNRSGGFAAFRSWVLQEFGRDSAGFVKLFLTADTIQKLRIAGNYTAALTDRVSMLEAAVQEHGFIPDVLSEEDFVKEVGQLTATLSRMSLGARQFEIPWTTLKSDAITRNNAAHDAYITMADAVAENLAVTSAMREFTYPFANGAVARYEVRNRDWPLAVVVGGVIDTILSHPTLGIEAILSVRIRHDSFRREFAAAIQAVQQGNIAGVRRGSVSQLTQHFGPSLYREIQIWLDRHMHTSRKSKPEAFFNFSPSQRDMATLLEASAKVPSLEAIVDLVVQWAQPRLDDHLEATRDSLVNNLAPTLASRINEVKDQLIHQGGDRQEITRVAQAVGAAVARRATEIQEWFKVPEADRCQSLTVREVWQAVQERFRIDISQRRLRYSKIPATLAERVLAPTQIRHLYDLLSELTHNALKHSKLGMTPFRLHVLRRQDSDCVVVSNLATPGDAFEERVQGHPYKTLHDSLFGEGKSGTKKVAYLAASIAREPLLVHTTRRTWCYHVLVPICSFGAA